MQPRGDPGMRDRHNRKTEEPGKPGTWVTRLDGTIDVPMSCKGTQKKAPPGWCGVRGSSEITLRTARFGREGQQGSVAKRWSRRTRAPVEGKIESRGVALVYPVGGKPGAQAQIARRVPQGKPEVRSARV